LIRAILALLTAFALLCPAWAQADAAGVLILGDSNSEGPFGGALYDALRVLRDPVSGAPLKVSVFAKCGAGANDWTSREYAAIDCGAWRCGSGQPIRDCRHFMGGRIPTLPDLYDDLGAARRVTLVVLGLNMIIGRRSEKLRDAENLVAAIRGQNSACIWIGPPQPGDLFVDPGVFDGFVADLKRTVTRAGCRFIASDDKTDRRSLGAHTKDDHYSRDDAVAWARKVLAELARPRNPADKPLLTLLARPTSGPD